MELARSVVESGRVRPFSPNGPRFPMEAGQYGIVAQSGGGILPMLEMDLKSPDPTVRCNAYDFLFAVAQGGRSEADRAKADQLLRGALKDDSAMVRVFAKQVLESATRPNQR